MADWEYKRLTAETFEEFKGLWNKNDKRLRGMRLGQAFMNYFGINNNARLFYAEGRIEASRIINIYLSNYQLGQCSPTDFRL